MRHLEPYPMILVILLAAIPLAGCSQILTAPTPLLPTPAQVSSPAATQPTSVPMSSPTGTQPTSARASAPSAALPTPSPVAEGTGFLLLVLFTESGKPPQTEAMVTIMSSRQTVLKGTTTQGMYRTTAPAGENDIVVLYQTKPEIGYMRKGVTVADGEVTTVAITVPSQGNLKLTTVTKSGKPSQNAHYFTISSGGEDIVSGSAASSSSYLLRSDLIYALKLKYGNQDTDELVKSDIRVTEGEATDVKLVLPFDEALLNVFTKVGGNPTSDGANVVVQDAAGQEVTSGYSRDKIAFYLRPDLDYEVRVTYKEQTLERAVRVTAEKTNEETFDFNAP